MTAASDTRTTTHITLPLGRNLTTSLSFTLFSFPITLGFNCSGVYNVCVVSEMYANCHACCYIYIQTECVWQSVIVSVNEDMPMHMQLHLNYHQYIIPFMYTLHILVCTLAIDCIYSANITVCWSLTFPPPFYCSSLQV